MGTAAAAAASIETGYFSFTIYANVIGVCSSVCVCVCARVIT